MDGGGFVPVPVGTAVGHMLAALPRLVPVAGGQRRHMPQGRTRLRTAPLAPPHGRDTILVMQYDYPDRVDMGGNAYQRVATGDGCHRYEHSETMWLTISADDGGLSGCAGAWYTSKGCVKGAGATVEDLCFVLSEKMAEAFARHEEARARR